MKLTKGEFCQFSLAARRQLLDDFGERISEKTAANKRITIYLIYGFYVMRVFDMVAGTTEKAEPVIFPALLRYLEDNES